MENVEPDLNRAISEQDWNLVFDLINSGADVNVKDVPGMTPLHLAARENEPNVVELLLKKGADANALTSMTRNPGGYCALACLADIRTQSSRWNETRHIAKIFFHNMEKKTFAVRTTTGKTLWHLLASQGKDRLLNLLLDWFDIKFGRDDIVEQLNTLTSFDGRTGMSVLDCANPRGSCFGLVASKGGVNVQCTRG